MYKQNFILALSALLAIGHAGSSHAYWQDNENENNKQTTISEDFDLPVTLNAKTQALDGKAKTSIFIDNVVIRQGSLELLADRVEVDATAGKRKEIIMASGNPASYKQRKDDGSMVQASANEIVYKVEPRTISLKGNASIVQNEVQVKGDSIIFDMAKEQILASTDDNSEDTVTTVISPGAFSISEEGDGSDTEKDPSSQQQEND